MSTSRKVLIIGGGIFGITAARTLAERGHEVHLYETGKIPNPRASSTDVSKMIRADYGSDTFYVYMMLEAFRGWEAWNAKWEKPLYHTTGFLLLTHEELQEGSLEYESKKALTERGVSVEPLTTEGISSKYPKWNAERFRAGYYNPLGGWAESGAVVAQLAEEARKLGVHIHEETPVLSLLSNGHKASGLFTKDGEVHGGDHVIVSAGVWSTRFIPELEDKVRITGHPIYLFKPTHASEYDGKVFPGWSADISKTGWYGFPANTQGQVKIAHHGEGIEVDPEEDNDIPPNFYPALNTFLSRYLPELEHVPIEAARMCYYCDTWDGNFYICPHPKISGLTIACGGSGHGFKFAPLLGDLIADVAEGQPNKYAGRFQWREKGTPGAEAARKR
jgi:glycine/D-amino acid oxidase-like deaminating enzyme